MIERDAAGLDRERLAALYKEHHLDVKYEKESELLDVPMPKNLEK